MNKFKTTILFGIGATLLMGGVALAHHGGQGNKDCKYDCPVVSESPSPSESPLVTPSPTVTPSSLPAPSPSASPTSAPSTALPDVGGTGRVNP